MTRARDVANLIGSGNYSSTTFTATAGQTVFSIAHTQNFVQVFMNGLLLDLTVDYTSNGSAVTLTSGAAAGDEIEVVAYNTFSVGDALNQAAADARYYTQSAADTRYVNTTGDTMTGQLTVDTATSANLTVDSGVYGGIQFKVAGTDTGYITSYTNGSGAESMYIGGADTVNLHTGTNHALTGGTTRLKINASGHVTIPNQPAFHVKGLGNTAASGGTANAGEVLLFNGLVYNNGSHYTAPNGRFTAPSAGIYYFSYSLLYDNTFNTSGSAALRKNGSLVGEYGYVEGGNIGYIQVSASAVVPCAANDYIDVYSYPAGWHVASESSFTGFMIG